MFGESVSTVHGIMGREKYMLGFEYVILFAIYLFVEEGPRTMLNFKDAGGIWKEDRFRPLITALANLMLNLILVNIIGLYGVLLSTILSFALIAFPWLIRNIHKCMFELPIVRYVSEYFIYAIVVFANSAFCYFINSRIYIANGVVELVVRFILCILISVLSFELVFWKKRENVYMITMLKSLIGIRNDRNI